MTRGVDLELVRAIRADLAAAANNSRATAMRAYMKSSMPYRGVPSPGQQAIYRRHVTAARRLDFDTWMATCLELWRKAEYREERYAALALAGHPQYREYQVPRTLPMYDEMITDGAWWDYVDAVAIHLVGGMLRRHRVEVESLLVPWRTDASMWRRRSSIIAQVASKTNTDTAFLVASIEPNLGDREFFIRKAIGWALRAYAWVDPDWVRGYVVENTARLSGLSRREALKNIGA